MKILIFGSPTTNGYKAFQVDRCISGGGWVENLVRNLSHNNDIELTVMFYADFVKSVQRALYNNVEYYALPNRVKNLTFCSAAMIEDLKNVLSMSSPDVVHIIGTEREHDYRLLQLAGPERTVVSTTGLVSFIAKHYYAGIDEKHFRFNTLGDVIRRSGIKREKKCFEFFGKFEVNTVKTSRYIMGRTTWDQACINHINSDVNYIYCGEILNPIFYENRWLCDNADKHRIFVSQASYPLKGFHKIIEALPYLLKKYPDCKVYIAGADITRSNSFMDKIKQSTYARYLQKLIVKNEIPPSVLNFIGPQNPEGMLEQYLRCRVFVLPSAIENSPNALGEAMILGTPCVASCVGGIQDMLTDRKEGFLYPFDEPYMLAHYIEKFFEDEELCIRMGNNAHIHAITRFNQENVIKTTLETYKEIYQQNNGCRWMKRRDSSDE